LVGELGPQLKGTLSIPVRAETAEAIVEEGRALAARDERVVVKVALHREGLRAIARLRAEGIRTHATLVCSANQALLAAKCGAYYVSPFVGKVEEQGVSGSDLVARIIDIYDNYEFETQVVVASVRHPQHVQEAAVLGADACTMSWAILQELVHHPLTDALYASYRAAWNRSG
jgi:transaldolase